MTSRERLRRTAAIGIRLATERRVRAVAQLLLAAGLVFVVLRLRSIWHSSHIDSGKVGWLAIAAAFVLACAAVTASGFVWVMILGQLGVPTRRRWAAIFLQAQIAKYIPGSVWQYAGRTALARQHGIPLRAVVTSLPAEAAACCGAAGTISLFVFGWWGLLGVVPVGVAYASRRRASPAAVRAALAAIPPYAVIWIGFGVSFWLVARGLVHARLGALPVYAGAFAVAWLVGFVAVYAPGGLGVREAMLVVLLHGRLGSTDALVVATVSRGVLTLADVATAFGSALLLRRLAPGDQQVAERPALDPDEQAVDAKQQREESEGEPAATR